MDTSKRDFIKAGTAGVFMMTAGGLLVIDDAKADLVTALGLLNAVITLLATINSMSDKSLAQQVSGSTEVARNQNYNDFNMHNSDPHKLMQTYSNGGTLPLNCQGHVSKDSLLTVQGGVPYLHKNGTGNTEDSNVNRWETTELSRVAREETGLLPIPASPRIREVSAQEDNLLGRKVDRKVWYPQYSRTVMLGNSKQSMIVATNGHDKKAILV